MSVPNRYVIYWGDQPAKDLRKLTPEGFTMVRRHGVRLVRTARSLVLAAPFLGVMSYEAHSFSPGLTALGYVLAVSLLLTAYLFYSHAQRLFKVQADDRFAEIDGHEVDGRGTVILRKGQLMWWTSLYKVKQVAALPPSSAEALAKIEHVPGGVTTRPMSPEEAAEYQARDTGISELNVFLIAFGLLVSFCMGPEAATVYIGVVGGAAILYVLRTFAHHQFKRVATPVLTVQVGAKVGRRTVRWAEFTPDGRPWTIEGEPAMWRRP